jgi:putative sigma-54 modulation protein
MASGEELCSELREVEICQDGIFQQDVRSGSSVQINISTRHGHLSDATRDKISAKVERLARLFERLTAIDVTVDLEHEQNPVVDVRVSAEHKHDFVAAENSTNLMAALDGVIHKLEQQLRKYKEKVQDHHRATAPKHETAPMDGEVSGE